jgi:hypothetical protein
MRWREWAGLLALSWLVAGCAKPIQFEPVAVPPPDAPIDLRVQLRLADETCAWPKQKSGESFCEALRLFAEALFAEVETVHGPGPHPLGSAQATLDPYVVYSVEEERFISGNIPFVGIEWSLSDAIGRIVWIQTIQTAGDGDLEDEKPLQAALRRSLEGCAEALRGSPEVAALATGSE